MKTLWLIPLLVAFSGCSQKNDTPTQQSDTNSGSVLTAPVDYLNAAAKAKQSAVKTIDTTSIDKAIQLFQVDKGRYPKDLNELVTEKYIPEIPEAPYGSKIVYDSNNGSVRVVKE
jgi:hypothetical protein